MSSLKVFAKIDIYNGGAGVVARAEPSELRSRASELRQLHATRFDYSERRAAADHASFSAEALWEHPTQPLSGPSLVGPDDDCALQALLDALAPENALLVNVLPGLTDEDEACDDQDDDEACASPLEAAWRSEKWHGARFRSKAAEPAALERYARASLIWSLSSFRLGEQHLGTTQK